MRLIIYWANTLAHCGEHITHLLNSLPSRPDCILIGSSNGLSIQIDAWADENGVPIERYLPQHSLHGDMAIRTRDQQMLDAADVLLTVWDGRDALCHNMLEMARASGLKCLQYNPYSAKPDKHLARKITYPEIQTLKRAIEHANPAVPFPISVQMVGLLLDAIERRDFVIRKLSPVESKDAKKAKR